MSLLPVQAPAALGLTIAAVPPAPAFKSLIIHFFDTFLERRVPLLLFMLACCRSESNTVIFHVNPPQTKSRGILQQFQLLPAQDFKSSL